LVEARHAASQVSRFLDQDDRASSFRSLNRRGHSGNASADYEDQSAVPFH
jgi:hypothetical protein